VTRQTRSFDAATVGGLYTLHSVVTNIVKAPGFNP
jgi:hypothetical protein